jgi:hypothetical protein
MNADGRRWIANAGTAQRSRASAVKHASLAVSFALIASCAQERDSSVGIAVAKTAGREDAEARDQHCRELYWGEAVKGLRLGIKVDPGPYRILVGGFATGYHVLGTFDRGGFACCFLENESLDLPTGCDGTVRIMAANMAIDPWVTGRGWGDRRPETAHLYRGLLDGDVRRIEELDAVVFPELLYEELDARPAVDSLPPEGLVVSASVKATLSLTLYYADSEGKLVGGSWSGSLKAEAPIAFHVEEVEVELPPDAP